MTVWEAISNNIVMAAGGPMGSPVDENWRKLFSTPTKAKIACVDDYKKTNEDEDLMSFKWKRKGRGWTAGDLGHVEYDVQPVKVW